LLLGFVVTYWVVLIGIGLWAGTLAKNSQDYAVAGRALPFYVVTATVFATWINLEIVSPDGLVPPQLAGLGMSLAGMIFGSLVSFAGGQKVPRINWFARR